jgi:hypothetical protein
MRGFFLSFVGLLICAAAVLTACSSNEGIAAQENLREKAANEATAIVAQAQATALVLQAQAQATLIVNQANAYNTEPVPEATWMAYVPTSVSTQEIEADVQVAPNQEPSEEAADNTVEVRSVGLAGEGAFIMVRFLAPADIAETWWSGSVSVEDEASGVVYDEIPVMPKIGPLIGRPKRDGQLGYVMLVNTTPGVHSGTVVTITLGDYRFEHIPVQ